LGAFEPEWPDGRETRSGLVGVCPPLPTGEVAVVLGRHVVRVLLPFGEVALGPLGLILPLPTGEVRLLGVDLTLPLPAREVRIRVALLAFPASFLVVPPALCAHRFTFPVAR
jgi:hypothetical protein